MASFYAQVICYVSVLPAGTDERVHIIIDDKEEIILHRGMHYLTSEKLLFVNM